MLIYIIQHSHLHIFKIYKVDRVTVTILVAAKRLGKDNPLYAQNITIIFLKGIYIYIYIKWKIT